MVTDLQARQMSRVIRTDPEVYEAVQLTAKMLTIATGHRVSASKAISFLMAMKGM